MIRILFYILLLLLAFSLAMLGVQKCQLNRMEKSGRKDGRRAGVERIPTSDTVRVATIKPIRSIAPVVVPPNVTISQIRDTVYRRKLERAPIVVGTERRMPKRSGVLKRRKGVDSLIIQTINPHGILMETRYPWRWVGNVPFQVDSAGRLHMDPTESEKMQRKEIRRENRRRTWRRIALTASSAGALVVGILIAR